MNTNDTQTPGGFAPGWYPDVNAPGTERYYDGNAWTGHSRPAVTVTAPTVGAEAKKSTNALGIVALAVSAVGFIFACVPGALIIGWVLLPVGFILGIVALFLTGKAKWPGLTAIIVSVLGTIVGVVVFFGLAAGAVSDALDESTRDGIGASEAPAEEAPAAEQAAATPQELVLGETSFGMDENGWGWYAVEITNPNEDFVFGMAALDVEAYDANGVLLDTDSTYGTILQGTSVWVGNFMDINTGAIDRIEVRGPTGDSATHSPAAETGSFTMGPITTGSEYGRVTVQGTVTSNFSEDQDMVRIDLVARNAAGEIVGVDYTYTDRVPAGGTAAWDVSLWEVPLDSTFEAYPHL